MQDRLLAQSSLTHGHQLARVRGPQAIYYDRTAVTMIQIGCHGEELFVTVDSITVLFCVYQPFL